MQLLYMVVIIEMVMVMVMRVVVVNGSLLRRWLPQRPSLDNLTNLTG